MEAQKSIHSHKISSTCTSIERIFSPLIVHFFLIPLFYVFPMGVLDMGG